MSGIDYSEKIPNNVNLANARQLQRALEHWQPRFVDWWKELGPYDVASAAVYLRTAVGVDAQGWAHYGTVKMPEYRWGIFLADPIADRAIGFGDSFGQPVWQQVPGEFRSQFRRLIVTQGDTEPASVEQQHRLGHTCPSLYDLRNLFQINVEEGRHLCAMAYILHAYFGRDGIVRRALEVMKQTGSDGPEAVRRQGAVDLPLLQRYLNCWFSSSLDLFGSEVSSNAATTFANGIKGRPDETTQYQDHVCADSSFEIEVPDGKGGIIKDMSPMRNAMNEVLRDAYIRDCEIGLKRWNMQIKRAGYSFELKLPSSRFRRAIGAWANIPTDLEGRPIGGDEHDRRLPGWLPSASDRNYVKNLMQRVVEPGKMAAWIAPPERGVNNLPVDYEYVRLN